MDVRNLTGLELLKAMQNGEMPPATITQTMPMMFKEIEEGRVLFHVTADSRHLNVVGGVHGGFAATVLDSVTGCAVHSMLRAGIAYGTIELNVKMMRPVPLDTVLMAEGRVINLSKSVGFAEGDIRNAEGKILAHATATCLIIR